MHQDHEHDHPGSVISLLRHQARRALTSVRAGWNDEAAWVCAFCGAETGEQQFWCSHCSRCRHDGEALSPEDISIHWERHFPTLVAEEEAEGRGSSSVKSADVGHDR